MNAVWLVIIAIFALWGVAAAAVGWIDAKKRRRHQHMLQTRDWQEKVEAMRRMHDQDGAA
jgi:Flp pilus assembly protein TadB